MERDIGGPQLCTTRGLFDSQLLQCKMNQLLIRANKKKLNIQFNYNIKQLIHHELKLHRKAKKHMVQAAILIQKSFRGYIKRKQIERSIELISRFKLEKQLRDLELYSRKCFLYLSCNATEAACAIQRCFRNYRIKERLHLLAMERRLVLQQKKEATLNHVRVMMRLFVCKEKINDLKSEHIKIKELIKIRQRLAVLYVKGKWKTIRENKQVIRNRRAVIKRKASKFTRDISKVFNSKYHQFSKEEFSGLFHIPNNPIALNTESDDSSFSENLNHEEYERYRTEKKQSWIKAIQTLKNSKKAYGLNEYKIKDHFPILKDGTSKYQGKNTNYILPYTIQAIPEPILKVRNTLIATPPVSSSKNKSFTPMRYIGPTDSHSNSADKPNKHTKTISSRNHLKEIANNRHRYYTPIPTKPKRKYVHTIAREKQQMSTKGRTYATPRPNLATQQNNRYENIESFPANDRSVLYTEAVDPYIKTDVF